VGLKYKKATTFSTYPRRSTYLNFQGRKVLRNSLWTELLSEDLGLPVSNNTNYSSRVCVKCVLKIWNTVELILFLKAKLNLVVTDVEETSETQQRWKRMSKSPSSAEKPKSARIFA